MTTTADNLSTEDLRALANHLVKRIAEIVAESEKVKAQLARVQRHVLVVDAVNQAQEREIADLKLKLHRRDASHAKLAAHCSDLEQRLDQAQQKPRTVRQSIWSSRSRQL